jgi:hypothetical protein
MCTCGRSPFCSRALAARQQRLHCSRLAHCLMNLVHMRNTRRTHEARLTPPPTPKPHIQHVNHTDCVAALSKVHNDSTASLSARRRRRRRGRRPRGACSLTLALANLLQPRILHHRAQQDARRRRVPVAPQLREQRVPEHAAVHRVPELRAVEVAEPGLQGQWWHVRWPWGLMISPTARGQPRSTLAREVLHRGGLTAQHAQVARALESAALARAKDALQCAEAAREQASGLVW